MEWAINHNMSIHYLSVLLEDFRDVDLGYKIAVIAHFDTNKNFEDYNRSGLISEFKEAVINMVNIPRNEIAFQFDTHERKCRN